MNSSAPAPLGTQAIKIRDFLAPSDVLIGVRAKDKDQLLRELCGRAASELDLDAAQVEREILKREELGSTGVGNGVALPHARLNGLSTPFGLLARLHRAIDFQAIDSQPVDIVFLVLLPEASATQLNALACVARALRHEDVLQRIRAAKDCAGLMEAVISCD
jgi:nitrogen PTS system EIIA component